MNFVSRRFEAWLAVVGVALLAPAIWRLADPPIDSEDAAEAYATFRSIPLPEISDKGSADILFEVPNSRQWERIRNAWGDPGYLLAAFRTPKREIYCWNDLGLKVQVLEANKAVPLREVKTSRNELSSKCSIDGVSFRATPGSKIRIIVSTARDKRPRDADLELRMNWDGKTKDRSVGVSIDSDIQTLVQFCGAVGAILFGSSAFVFLRRKPRLT